MPLVMPGVQADIDTPIVILLMQDCAPCNPLADSIRPDPENLCRLRYRVPLRHRRVLLRHALHHALILPAVLGILPLPGPFALVVRRRLRTSKPSLGVFREMAVLGDRVDKRSRGAVKS